MNVILLGATGATGRHLLRQLLDNDHHVIALVRGESRIPDDLKGHGELEVISTPALEMDIEDLAALVDRSDAVASCLGHNLTFRGMFGKPRRLVTDSIRKVCKTAKASDRKSPLKIVLMNTSGNVNHDNNEKVSFAQRCVLFLIRNLIPPHADNEDAANFLRDKIGSGKNKEDMDQASQRPSQASYPGPIGCLKFN